MAPGPRRSGRDTPACRSRPGPPAIYTPGYDGRAQRGGTGRGVRRVRRARHDPGREALPGRLASPATRFVAARSARRPDLASPIRLLAGLRGPPGAADRALSALTPAAEGRA